MLDRMLRALQIAAAVVLWGLSLLLSLALVMGCEQQKCPAPAPAPKAPPAGPPGLMVFGEPWCSACRTEEPKLHGLLEDFVGLCQFTLVSVEGKPHGPWVNVTGEQARKAYSQYGVSAIPAAVLLDGRGREVGRWVGAGHSAEIASAIDKCLQ